MNPKLLYDPAYHIPPKIADLCAQVMAHGYGLFLPSYPCEWGGAHVNLDGHGKKPLPEALMTALIHAGFWRHDPHGVHMTKTQSIPSAADPSGYDWHWCEGDITL